MAQMLARKDMTVQGEKIKAGNPVPMDKLSPDLRRKLVDQRRVEPDKITVKEG